MIAKNLQQNEPEQVRVANHFWGHEETQDESLDNTAIVQYTNDSWFAQNDQNEGDKTFDFTNRNDTFVLSTSQTQIPPS